MSHMPLMVLINVPARSGRRRPAPGVPAPAGLPPAAGLLLHLAGHRKAQLQALRQGGGVRHHGDADGPGAHERQADGPADPGPQGAGTSAAVGLSLF